MKSITIDEINEKIKNQEMFALKFWATWCNPCKAFDPIAQKVYQTAVVDYYEVNIEKHPEIAQKFNVTSIPSVVGIKKGVINFRAVGAVSYNDLFVKTQMMSMT